MNIHGMLISLATLSSLGIVRLIHFLYVSLRGATYQLSIDTTHNLYHISFSINVPKMK